MLENILKTIALLVAGIVIVALVLLINGAIIMVLWNWIMPFLFGLPEISLFMAVGIYLLLALTLGGLKAGFSR